jgi:hypothetical protein
MPINNKELIGRYLTTHAEPEALDAARLVLNCYKYCLVIPAFQEEWEKLQRVWEKIDPDCLTILVINASTKDDPQTIRLRSDIEANSESLCSIGPLTCLTTHDRRTLLLVDRCNNPVPAKQGVGLARKIGADIALTLINKIPTPTSDCPNRISPPLQASRAMQPLAAPQQCCTRSLIALRRDLSRLALCMRYLFAITHVV